MERKFDVVGDIGWVGHEAIQRDHHRKRRKHRKKQIIGHACSDQADTFLAEYGRRALQGIPNPLGRDLAGRFRVATKSTFLCSFLRIQAFTPLLRMATHSARPAFFRPGCNPRL